MESRNDLVFSKLYSISPIGIEIIDVKERKLVSANKWMNDHMGYTSEEFQEMSTNLFEKIIHPEDRTTQQEAYQALTDNPNLLFKEFAVRIRKKNGEYVHGSIRLTVLEVNEKKEPTTMLGTAMDVTEIVKLKRQLDDQLNKINIISYKNSHELRGPVATILGLIQLIDYGGMDGHHSKEIINSLKETVVKLDNVIHDINKYSF